MVENRMETGWRLYNASGIRWQRMVVRQPDEKPLVSAGNILAFAMLRLVRASAVFPGLPLLRGSSGEVRARSAKASIACQNIASAVAVFEGAILAVPIHATCADLDRRAPRSLCALRVSWPEAYRCKTSRSHQNHAYHHLSNSMQGLVIHQRGYRYSIIFVAALLLLAVASP